MSTCPQHFSLFIDESGVADLKDSKYRFFLLTGVLINQKDLADISGYFNFIKKRYELNINESFHAYDLFESYQKLSLGKANQLIKSMVEFIDTIPLHAYCNFIDKLRLLQLLDLTTDDLRGSKEALEMRSISYRIAAVSVLGEVSLYLAKTNSLGFIQADSRATQDIELLKSFWQLKQRHFKKGLENPMYESAKRTLISITFAEKPALSCGVQLADIVSFTVYAHLARRMSFFKEVGLDRLWKTLSKKISLKDATSVFEKK